MSTTRIHATMQVKSRKSDLDAAQTLLALHGSIKREVENHNDNDQRTANGNEMENGAKVILNYIISSEVTAPVNGIPQNKPQCSSTPKTPKHKPDSKKGGLSPKKLIKVTSEGIKEHKCKGDTYRNVTTRDVGTQTDFPGFGPYNEATETTIKNLCDVIKTLQDQLQKTQSTKDHSREPSVASGTENEDNLDFSNDDDDQDPDYDVKRDEYRRKRSTSSQFSKSASFTSNNTPIKESQGCRSRALTCHNVNTKSMDMVPIGEGNATVPSRILKHINWNSYSSATRKLLTAVFSRRVLATHSLTGKPSPAFPNKPAKKRLDPALVNDIVQTVVERCNVPESVVRTSITTKCADESKMLRTRQKNNKSSKKNVENIPPTSSDSDSEN